MSNQESLDNALEENDVDAFVALLNRPNVDVDFFTDDGTPLLAEALNRGYVQIAMALVRAGADVNLGNNGLVRGKYRGKTPLNGAICLELNCPQHVPEQDRVLVPGLVQYLIDHGARARLTRVTDFDVSPLQMCLFHRHDLSSLDADSESDTAKINPKFWGLLKILLRAGAKREDLLESFHEAYDDVIQKIE